MTQNYFCLRYLILGCLVILGISGLVVCSASSYFIHQNNKYDYSSVQLENIQGPPGILLAMGLLTCGFAIYFWFIIDYKYNGIQFTMIVMVMNIIALIEASMGIWSLVMHGRLDIMLSISLEKSLAVSKINSDTALSNITALKFNCCGYNETILDLSVLSSYHCCNFGNMDDASRDVCHNLHGKECKHLIINQNRSILHQTFLLALCSVILQIFVIASVFCYAKFLRKQEMRRQFTIVTKPSAPCLPR